MAAQQDFWGQFEVVEYDKPQYDWGQFEQVPQNKHALETSLKELPENDPYVKTQKHQTEQLANMLFTAEERKAIENKGEIGWWEYAKNYADLSEAVPFYGTGKQIAQTSKVYSIAKKLENGEEVTAADKSYMQDYLKKYTETQLRGTSWGAKGASMLIQAPAFIGEFIATAGVGATAGKGAIIAGVKGAGAAATKAAIKAGTKVATSKALSTIAGEQAVKTIGTKAALETSAKLAGKAATQQAVLVPMYAVQNYNEKKIADGLNLTDKGSDVLYNTQKADSSASWAKSFGIGEIEILSEMSGGLLGYMAGGVTRGITTAATKIGGKVATTNVARGISAVSAKVYNSIPKEARIKLEAAARLTDKLGKKLNTVSEKLKQPSIGFHGVAEEMGEERLGDVLKYAFDLDEKEGYLDENGNFDFEQLGSAIFPGWQQLLLEAGVFSIVGGGSFATRTVINNLKEKGYSDKEATTISQNLSEIEKENMANEILGEVKINEDIKEQEVIKEQVKIENAMLKGGISITENTQENTTEKQKPKTLSDYKKDILSNKFDEGKIDTIKHKYNGRVINQVFKSEDNDFRYANREFNKIINDIYKNPSIIDNKEEYDNLETQLESVINSLPYNDKEEVTYPYYEKFYNAVNSAGEYLEAKKKKTKAAELYDMADTAGATPSQEEAPKKQPKTLKEVEEIADKEAEKAEEKRGFKELYGDFKDAFSNFIEPFYAGAVDRLAPIQNTVKKANKKGAEIGIELGDKNWSENPYYMARMYSGLANRIWQHFTENTMKRAEDGTQKITGEGFGKIIEDLYKETKDIESNKETQLKDFEDYLIAKRFLLDLKDREGYEATEEQKLKAVQDMARLAEKYGEDMTTLEKLADRVYEYNRRTLHLLVDSGNMSQETYDKIIEQNPHHISYKRVMDDNYGTNGLSFAKGKFTDAKSPIKKIRGSEREIQSIYKSTLEDTMRIIDVAERNRIASKVAALKEYLPEDIKSIKPKMEKRTAKVKVTYDAKMRSQLEEAIKFFGRTFKNVKSIKTPQGYALGSYSEEEKEVRKKLGSQDRTLAHEVGHMLDFALDVENQIKNDSKIMQEIKTLAEDRFKSTVKLQDGEFITEDAGSTEKYKNYVQSNKEAVANAFDLYFTSRDYVKRVAPETAKFIDNLFKGEYAFLNEIRPSSETATEEIEQDVWTPSNRKPSDNSIGYYENGKIKFVEVNPNVMETVNDLSVNPKQMGKIISAVDAVLSRSSALLRTGATLNPEFILRNPIRDIQEAWFNIDGFNPIIDVPKGLLAVIGKKNSKLYKEWQREGGSFNSYMELNDKTISQALNLYKENKTIIGKIIDFVPSKIKKGLSFLEAISSTLEETTRLGIYNAMLRKGLSPSQAAFMSREGTLDFSRMGKDVRILNRWKAFLNASIQGSDRVVRTILADPKTALIKGMQMAAFQALLSGYYLYQAPDDEREEYLEIPDWQKKLFFLFKFGGRWWKIPRAFAPGFLFQATTENFMIWAATKEKPEGLELFNFAKGLFEATSPITDISSVLTPLVQIALENTVNYNFFTKQRLYPEYLNDYEPSERYTKKTSETAKLLGEKLNISPAKIENALRGQLGNLARYGTDLGDLMINTIKKAIGEEVNEKPDDKGRYPIVRGFSVDDPIGNHSKSLNSFYETYNKLSKINNTLNKKEKENYEDAIKYEEKHLEEIEKFNLIKGSYKEITELRKEANEIYKNPSIDGKEKADLISEIEEQMTEIAREANEKLKE